LPAVDVETVLAAHSKLLARARRAVGGDDESFARHFLKPVQALAREVHLLPSSASDHFAGSGGLLRQSIDCAMQCAQAARGRIFTPERTARERQALEPRWLRAAFLGGLTCELSQTLDSIVVCSTGGEEWPKEMLGLDAWLVQAGHARYHVSWLPRASRAGVSLACAAVVGRIIPFDVMTWLRAGDPEMACELFAIAAGAAAGPGSRLAGLVQDVRNQVRKVDEVRRPSLYGRLRVGHHLEIHVLDALRTGVERRALEGRCGNGAGTDTPALLLLKEGSAFVRWPEGAQAIVQELVARGLPGIPRASRTLLDSLAGAGLLEARADGSWLWPLEDGDGFAVKFPDERILLPAGVATPGPRFEQAGRTDECDDVCESAASPVEEDCLDRWRRAWAVEPGCDVLPLGDGRIAVSHRLACASHPDPVRLVQALRERGWLVVPAEIERGAPGALVSFRDGRRPALLLTAEAARHMHLGPG
jgi:conjugal transfer pilus assembly protein TraI